MSKSLLQPDHLRLHLYHFLDVYGLRLSVGGVKDRGTVEVVSRDGVELGTHKVKFGVESLRQGLERLLLRR